MNQTCSGILAAGSARCSAHNSTPVLRCALLEVYFYPRFTFTEYLHLLKDCIYRRFKSIEGYNYLRFHLPQFLCCGERNKCLRRGGNVEEGEGEENRGGELAAGIVRHFAEARLKIHCLLRLRRERSRERLSRSWQLVEGKRAMPDNPAPAPRPDFPPPHRSTTSRGTQL